MRKRVVVLYEQQEARADFIRSIQLKGDVKFHPERVTLTEVNWFRRKTFTEYLFFQIEKPEDTIKLVGLSFDDVVFVDGYYSANTINRVMNRVGGRCI